MRFSVIVPFLNEERYIARCILALQSQRVPQSEVELIFVDNGSVDASAEVVRRYADVRLVTQVDIPHNVYASRNRGAELASGDILAFTDADCAPVPAWLAEIEAGMLSTGAQLVLGRRIFPAGVSRALRLFETYENAKAEYVVGCGERRFLFGFGNNMAIRRNVFEELGGFAELPLCGDTEMVQRYIEKRSDAQVTYLDGMCIEHLEVTTVMAWLKKIKTYGAHNRQVKAIRHRYENLPLQAKIEIARRCAQKNGLGVISTAGFLLLLAIGNLFYALGTLARPVSFKSSGA